VQTAIFQRPVESTSSLRQYLVYPDEASLMRRNAAKLPSYRLLIETVDGKIWFMGVDQRAVPDRNTVGKIAAILVGSAKGGSAIGLVEARLCDEAGVVAHDLDNDIEDMNNWGIDAVLADALLVEVSRLSSMAAPQLKNIRHEFKQKMELDLSMQLEPFIAELDDEVIALIRSNSGLKHSSYNYLIGEDATSRRNRLQAVKAFPLLFSSLAGDKDYARIREAINHGAPPLFDMLSEFYGVKKSVIKFMAKISNLVIEEVFQNKVGVLVRLIADIQPEFRPNNPSDWERFFSTVMLICKVSRRPISTTSNRLWLRSCSRMRFNLPDGGPPAIDHAAIAIDDLMAGIREALYCELLDVRHQADYESAVSAVIAYVNMLVGIDKLAQIGRRYGDALRKEQHSFLKEQDVILGLCWISPIPEPMRFYGLTAVPLCTPKDLIDEAARMDNCVDTYAGRCMRGESQLWSLRSEDGSSLSTLDVRVERSSVVAVQHRGVSNRDPSPECALAAHALIKHLCKPGAVADDYWRWKSTIAKYRADQRAMIALTKPIIAALKATLPKRISFDNLVQVARDHAARQLVGGATIRTL
jgi:hypothetical protein